MCETAEKFGLSESDARTIARIFSAHDNVARVVVFGSRAKGNFRAGSDIDMAIFGGADFSHDDLLSLCGEFDESDLPHFVDLVDFAQIENPALREHIERIGKTIFER